MTFLVLLGMLMYKCKRSRLWKLRTLASENVASKRRNDLGTIWFVLLPICKKVESTIFHHFLVEHSIIYFSNIT